MAKYGRSVVSTQLTSEVDRITSSNDLPFKDALSSEHFAEVFAAASLDYRERIFSPSDDAACLYGADPLP